MLRDLPLRLCLPAVVWLAWCGSIFQSAAQVSGGQEFPGATLSVSSEPNTSISGTVVNSVTGEPVPRALVQVQAGSQRAVLTDADGRFELGDLPATRLSVTVRRPGFFELSTSYSPLVTGQDLASSAPALVVRLNPESVIFGRVQSPEDEPIEHLPVRAIALHLVDGRKRLQVIGSSPTDVDGQYRIPNLPAGAYLVEVGPGNAFGLLAQGTAHRQEHGYAGVFYGGAREMTSATPIQLEPGEQLRADFTLKLEPLYQVSGFVAGSREAGNVNLLVVDSAGETLDFGTEIDAATGKFQTKLPAGFYTLLAETPSGAGPPLSAVVHLAVDSDLSGIRVALAPNPSIAVRESLEASAPQPAANQRFPWATVRLRAVSGPREDAEFWALNRWPGSDPVLVLGNVPPGRYQVEVSPKADQWYVQSVDCGGADLLREDLVVTAGAQVPEIDVVLRDGGAELHGATSAPATQATVLLIPEAALRPIRTASTDSRGDFEFSSLPPGHYSVLAFAGQGPEYSDPDQLSPFLSQAVRVDLQPNGKAAVTLDLVSSVK
jgi:Carboxypeptidase regulatory-like domain